MESFKLDHLRKSAERALTDLPYPDCGRLQKSKASLDEKDFTFMPRNRAISFLRNPRSRLLFFSFSNSSFSSCSIQTNDCSGRTDKIPLEAPPFVKIANRKSGSICMFFMCLRDICVTTSNSLIDSILSPKNSIRTGCSNEIGKISTIPPRMLKSNGLDTIFSDS